MKLDKLHSKILEHLQRNARISNTAIAKEVGISSPAVTERIKKLEDAGLKSHIMFSGLSKEERDSTMSDFRE